MRALLILNQLQNLFKIRQAVDAGLASCGKDAQDRPEGNMEDRQNVARGVFRCKMQRKNTGHCQDRTLPVAYHDSLGKPRGPSRIHEDRHVGLLDIVQIGIGFRIRGFLQKILVSGKSVDGIIQGYPGPYVDKAPF